MREQLNSLLDECFGALQYTQSFPHIFKNLRTDLCVLHEAHEKITAFCSLYPVNWLWKGSLVRAYCIGNVCVAEEERGKGLGLQLLAKAEERAREKRADAVFLFSELEDFYGRAGYKPAGKEHFVSLSEAAPESMRNRDVLKAQMIKLSKTGFERGRRFEVVDNLLELPFERILELWKFLLVQGDKGESLLGLHELCLALRIPAMRLFLVYKNDELKACAFLGKGSDFVGVIHGVTFCETADLMWLIGKALERVAEPMTLMLGTHEASFRKYFSTLSTTGFLWKPLDSRREAELQRGFDKSHLYVRSLHSS